MMNTRTNSDLANTAVLAAPVLIVTYLVYRWFGFEFILGNGPMFIGLALFVLALRLRYWWPAAFLMVQVSFQSYLIYQFGLWANFMTVAAIAAFLSRQAPESLPRVLLETTTQRLMALFLLGTLVSMLWSEQAFRVWLDLFQKIALFLVVATFVGGFGRGARIETLAWLAIVSVTVLYLLSALEFYVAGVPLLDLSGTSILGIEGSSLETGAGTARLDAYGVSYSPNKFAFVAILPMSMAIGMIVAHPMRPLTALAAGAWLTLGFGILLTGSRAGAMAALVSVGAILLITGHGQRRLRLGSVAFVVVLVAVWLLQLLLAGLNSYDRIVGRVDELRISGQAAGLDVDERRRELWRLGVTLFRENPISGVGLRKFETESASRFNQSQGFTPHSAYVQVLAETGLLGAVPFAILLGHVGWVLLRTRKALPRHLNVWRAIFAGAFVGMAFFTIFGSSQYVRFFWIPVAFAAFLESEERRNAREDSAVTTVGVPSDAVRVDEA